MESNRGILLKPVPMTDYETVSLFYQVIAVANASLANYLTVVSAMLVASYLVADKLDRFSSGLVLAIFSIFSIGMINEVRSAYRDFARLGVLISELAAEPGSSLGWHPVAGSDGAGFRAIPVVITVVCSLAYLGSLWFFFHTRRSRCAKTGLGDPAESSPT